MTAIVYQDHPTQEGGIELKRGPLEECLAHAQVHNYHERFTNDDLRGVAGLQRFPLAFCWVEVVDEH